MVENLTIGFVVSLMIFEYVEISWQKGETLKELLAYNYITYQYGSIYYFTKHTAFLFIVFTIVYTNMINSYTITLLFMKFLDIGFKLYVVGEINNKGEVFIAQLFNNQDYPLSNTIRYSNMFIYPSIMYLGLTF
jgi:hypothetical protein